MTAVLPLLSGTLALHVEEAGEGPAVLLHGGGGSGSMRPLLGALERRRALLPTVPGSDGTPRIPTGSAPSPTSARPTWRCSRPWG